MNASGNKSLFLVMAAFLAVIALAVYLQPAQAQRAALPAVGPHYTVVHTEGHNLIVTDNQDNVLYFYTIDKDKEIGSELKLRGKVDLNQVGKPEIKPVNVNIEKPQQ
jgi:hypothetical protein